MGQRPGVEAHDPLSPPPEAQVASYHTLAWNEEDQKKMIRVSHEELMREEQMDPLSHRLVNLRPIPQLGPSPVKRRWDFTRSHAANADYVLESLKSGPLIEMMAKFQTYSMKRCNLVAQTQMQLLISMHTADQVLNKLNTLLLAKQDTLRRVQLRLSEVPRLQQCTEETHSLLADIVGLLHDIHSYLPASLKAHLQGFGTELSAMAAPAREFPADSTPMARAIDGKLAENSKASNVVSKTEVAAPISGQQQQQQLSSAGATDASVALGHELTHALQSVSFGKDAAQMIPTGVQAEAVEHRCDGVSLQAGSFSPSTALEVSGAVERKPSTSSTG